MVVGNELVAFPDVGSTADHRISFYEWHPTGTDFQRGLVADIGGVKSKGKLADHRK